MTSKTIHGELWELPAYFAATLVGGAAKLVLVRSWDDFRVTPGHAPTRSASRREIGKSERTAGVRISAAERRQEQTAGMGEPRSGSPQTKAVGTQGVLHVDVGRSPSGTADFLVKLREGTGSLDRRWNAAKGH